MPLKKDLAELLAHNVISLTTARDIERYYDSKKQQPTGNLLLIIFGIAGSALAGLGIILIFAHNWDNFTKPVKTGLAFLPLVLSQLFAAWCIVKKKGLAFKEPAATLLFFSVGAAISLVAQIYNLPGNMQSFLCTWALLCLPLVYVLNSQMCVLLTLVFATWYTGAAPYSHDIPYMYLMFVALVVPYYVSRYKKQPDSNFVSSFGWALPLSLMMVLGTFTEGYGLFSLALYMALGCLLYNISNIQALAKTPRALYGSRVTGLGAMLLILFISSFHTVWQVAMYWGLGGGQELIVWSILIVAALAAAGMAWRKGNSDLYMLLTAVFPLLYATALLNSMLPAIVANVALLAISIATINSGIVRYRFDTLNLGLGLLAVLVTCRFFDLEISFAIRGMMFLAVGAGFFGANLILARRKKTQTLNTTNNED